MNDLIAQLQECKRTMIAAKKVFGKYGLHFEEDVTKPLGLLKWKLLNVYVLQLLCEK